MTKIQPDFVKLDMTLIRDVDRDGYKSCVAGKILELARELGAKTVAECVETEAEWLWAREHGADYSQGYLFARPNATPPQPQIADCAQVSSLECREVMLDSMTEVAS